MKAIFILAFLLVSCTLGQDTTDIVASWSGTTQNGPTFYAPNPAVGNPCFVVVNPSAYVVVNFTFTTSAVREVVLLAEPSFKSVQQVFLYTSSFTPSSSNTNADSCNNFVRVLSNQNFVSSAGIESVDDPVNFAANTLYFFVISSSNGDVGRFTLNILGSVSTGTTVGGPIWTPSSLNSGSCANTTNTLNGGIIQQNLATYVWSQPTTGTFDILVMFEYIPASSNSVYFSLYKGNYDTNTIAANPCLFPLNSSIYVTAQEGDPTTLALAQPLTQNAIYTIAVSNIQAGRWSLQVRPTRLVHAVTAGFPQPSRTLPCTPSTTNTNAGYVFVSFVAQYQTYFLDTYTIPSYLANTIPPWVSFPTYSFAYSGNNTLPSACPASANLIASAATGSNGPLVFSTTVGRTYSVLISVDSAIALNSSSAAQVYLFSGATVGNTSSYVPDPTIVTTTTSTSTGTTTGNRTTTSTSTSGTSGTHSTTTTTTTLGTSSTTKHSSAVATASFSALLLLGAAIAAL